MSSPPPASAISPRHAEKAVAETTGGVSEQHRGRHATRSRRCQNRRRNGGDHGHGNESVEHRRCWLHLGQRLRDSARHRVRLPARLRRIDRCADDSRDAVEASHAEQAEDGLPRGACCSAAARRHDGPRRRSSRRIENLKLLDTAAVRQAAADRLQGRHRRRQERDLQRLSAKRSCTAPPPACRAQRSAKRSTCKRRPVRAARIPLADRRSRHLRTADRQHRLEQGLERRGQEHLPRRVQGRARTARRMPGSTRFPTCATPRSPACSCSPATGIAPAQPAPRGAERPSK